MRRVAIAAIGSALVLGSACGPLSRNQAQPSEQSQSNQTTFDQSDTTIDENPDPIPELGMGGGPTNAYGPGPYAVGGKFKAVSVGLFHACALRDDGTVACWGKGTASSTDATCLSPDVVCGQAHPPSGTFTQISAGAFHTCGVHSDGTLECWGAGKQSNACDQYECGQANPPSGQFLSVSAGDNFTCGVRLDGTLSCWGAGKTENSCLLYACGQALPPSGTFKTVTATYRSACALAPDGYSTCWGNPDFLPASSEKLTKISAGQFGVCGLRTDATLSCPDTKYSKLTPPSGTFIDVSVTSGAACAIAEIGGRIVCWADSDGGYIVNAPLGEYKALSIGGEGCALRKSDSALVCWGGGNVTSDVPKN